jgi:hypothetical protein
LLPFVAGPELDLWSPDGDGVDILPADEHDEDGFDIFDLLTVFLILASVIGAYYFVLF